MFEGAPHKQERGMGASVVFVCYGLDNQSVFLCQSYTFLRDCEDTLGDKNYKVAPIV